MPERRAENTRRPWVSLLLIAIIGLAATASLKPEWLTLPAVAATAPKLLGTVGEEVADREILLGLERRRRQLDEREAALDREAARLADATAAVNARTQELNSLRVTLQTLMDREEIIKAKKYKEMASIHSAMPTQKSADILAALDDDTAVRIMNHLTDPRVAKTISKMPADRALGLSEAYLGLKERRGKSVL